MAHPSKSLKSQLLIATPELQDPNFAETVVLLIEHSEDGALGVVLNRPLEKNISDLLDQVFHQTTESTAPVFWGGPVVGPLMVLHRLDNLGEVQILPDAYFTTSKEHIEQILETHPDPVRFFVGCAGWGAGQLEFEIEEGAWEVLPANAVSIFDGSPELWKTAAMHASFVNLTGRSPKHLPPDPSSN